MSITVTPSGAARTAVEKHVPELVSSSFASRLFAQDATLWGPEAEAEAAVRLSWVGLPTSSRPLLEQVAALREELRAAGVDHIALCGMGGSSLAPEVICKTAGVELTVLDSSHPDMVRTAIADRIDTTAVVVSSKSGSTVETDSHRRAFIQAFDQAGLEPTERIIIVTDPGSPLDESAREQGFRVINADPEVGGRYSALTAFGLVPSGLAGADIAALLDEAHDAATQLSVDEPTNPGLVLGAAMVAEGRDKLIIVDDGIGIPGFGDWAEQLIAESTGKDGRGVLPVVVEGPQARLAAAPGSDCTVAMLGGQGRPDASSAVRVAGPLGAQLLLWEVATATAGALLGINPFDQPNVEAAKKAARALMDSLQRTADEPQLVDGAIEVRTGGALSGQSFRTLEEAVEALLDELDQHVGYLSVQAYLDRWADAELASVRAALGRRTHRPVTFGWGPRFLHSTGQIHKGGPAEGAYLQITSEPVQDLEVPGKELTFATLIAAQAKGDAAVLAEAGRPVLRLHLTDHDAGLSQLITVLGGGSAQ